MTNDYPNFNRIRSSLIGLKYAQNMVPSESLVDQWEFRAVTHYQEIIVEIINFLRRYQS